MTRYRECGSILNALQHTDPDESYSTVIEYFVNQWPDGCARMANSMDSSGSERRAADYGYSGQGEASICRVDRRLEIVLDRLRGLIISDGLSHWIRGKNFSLAAAWARSGAISASGWSINGS
jgi:hypothetical protein